MKSSAKITMNSLKNYSDSVQHIVDFTTVATEAMSDFDNLIASIGVEIERLEEKKNQLTDAETIIENKITECEGKIEETQTRIDELNNDLDRIQSELAVTDEYISYIDSEGNWHEKINWHYTSLERQESAVERKLSLAKTELNDLEHLLSRCRSLKGELSTVLSAIENRITNLYNNKNRAEKNKSEYSSAIVSIKNHSLHATSKLSMIERSVKNYMGISLKISSAYETANRKVGYRNLSDLAYMGSKFMDMEKKELIRRQDAAILRCEKRGLENCDSDLCGKYGEMKTDQSMRDKGFERISKDMIRDEESPLDKGIDGVYFRRNGEPQFAIVESKFNKSKLNPKTADGKQMSTRWIIHNRLEDAVGKDMADTIIEQMLLNPNNVGCYEARVDLSGNVKYSKLDSEANMIEEGVQL